MHVFKAKQFFVELILAPHGGIQSGVRVIAEKTALRDCALWRIQFAEYFRFAEQSRLAADLPPVGQGDITIRDRLNQVAKPIISNGNAMPADEHEHLSRGLLAPNVQRSTE